ncbi:MAG: H-X9-DG-CTERM domain-containing protein [Isosphaeraceae bacterium]
MYNHYLTPNSKKYDCWQSSPPHNPALKAARSNHPGGVNLLFCDGHVAFAKDTVNLATWRAAGDASVRRGCLGGLLLTRPGRDPGGGLGPAGLSPREDRVRRGGHRFGERTQ